MSGTPRVLVQAEKFRIVELPNGEKTVERFDGLDAMGGERWRDLKFGEADQISRLMRDWIFAHTVVCPLVKESGDEHR